MAKQDMAKQNMQNQNVENKDVAQYFLKYTDRLSYLEIKQGVALLPNIDMAGLSVPVLTDDFLDGIQTGTMEESLDFRFVLRGILVNYAADRDFVYMDRYLEILRAVAKDPVAFALREGRESLEKPIVPNRHIEKGDAPVSEDTLAQERMKEAIAFFRAAHFLDDKNVHAAYHYARLLWRVDDVTHNEPFVEAAIRLLEQILRIDEGFSLAYDELGDIYRAMSQFGKATAFYQKAMQYCEVEPMREAIRKEIEAIADETDLEEALYFIQHANYEKAISILNNLKARTSRFDVSYYLGVAFENIAKYDIAIDHFEEAQSMGADFPDLYTNLCFCYNAVGDYQKGIAIATEGLEQTPTNVRLRYNRAILYYQVEKPKEAMEDLEEILSYQDISDELFSAVMQLREIIKGK